MPRSGSFDPLDRFRWRVYVASGNNWVRSGFESCSTPGITISYKTYNEGGSHMSPRKIHDSAAFKAITLSRGVVNKDNVDDFARWMSDAYKAFSPQEGDSTAAQYRNNIVIEHLDRDSSVVKRWVLFNCVPTEYSPASDFSSMDESAVSLETLSFEYEGFEEIREGTLESPGDFFRRYTRGIF